MSKDKKCHICGQPAKYHCFICGKPTCGRHFTQNTDVCADCAAKGKGY